MAVAAVVVVVAVVDIDIVVVVVVIVVVAACCFAPFVRLSLLVHWSPVVDMDCVLLLLRLPHLHYQ